MLFITFNSELR